MGNDAHHYGTCGLRRARLQSAIVGCSALLIANCSSSANHDQHQSTPANVTTASDSAGGGAAVSGEQASTASGGMSAIQGQGGARAANAPSNAAIKAGAGGATPSKGDAPADPRATAGSAATAGSGTAAAGQSGGEPASAGATGSAGAEAPDVPCNPADAKPEPTEVQFAAPSEGPGLSTPTGEFKPIMESDPGIPTHTIIRPEPLGKIKHPILAWGEGGCGKSGNIGMFSNLFMEFASQGILIVADGPPGDGPTMDGQDAKPLLFAIDWAQKENERPCSKYYHKLAVDKVAVSGQSCGGLMAIQAATDPKITTAFPYDSGLFSRDQSIYDALHAPMAIFDGGDQDIAYENGLADFNAITKIPMLFANPTSCSSNAHVCTFFDSNAGEFGRAGVAWMRWHLLGDQGATGKGMFIGDSCGLCGAKWTLMWKNAPM